MVSPDIRNTLIRSLRFRYGVPEERLTDMFRLKLRTIKSILKTATSVPGEYALENFSARRTQLALTANIKGIISRELASQKDLITIKKIQAAVKEELGTVVPYYALRKIMRADMGLKWRCVRSQDHYVNTAVNLQHRFHFAVQMVTMLEQGKTLINFDESSINSTTSRSFSWVSTTHNEGRWFKKLVSGMSILLAATSNGEIFFQFLDGNNNQESMAEFLVLLSEQLDYHIADWRDTHVLLLDNCPSHKTAAVKEVLHKLQVPTIYSAPASFLAIPVEGLFGAIKGKNFLNEADPDAETLRALGVKKLTNKQRLILKISNYLYNIDRVTIRRILARRLRKLEHFL